MKAVINFNVEPSTNYIYTVASWDEARHDAFELARRMNRRAWTVTCGDYHMAFDLDA